MAEWGAVAEETPNPRTKMLPLRNSPRTVDVCPRTNFLRSDAGFTDPVALCGISHPGNYECVPKFVTFCKLRAGISGERREKRKRPSGFRKISHQNNFPGRPLSRPLESA